MSVIDTDRLFETAGEAAELLEQMGFVAVAKRKGGVVSLELWKGTQAMRYELPLVQASARAIADACAAEYRVRVGDDEPSGPTN